jgi:hypothetical protein
MTAEHEYGDGFDEPDQAGSAELGVRAPDEPLAVTPAGASVDDLEVFPHDRFLAALDGRTSMHEYALDALRHVVVPLRHSLG